MYVICLYVLGILLCFQVNVCNMLVCTRYFTLFQLNVCNMLVCTRYFTLLTIEGMLCVGMYPVFYSAFN